VIAVIDYKAGNLASVMKAVAAVAGDAVLTADPDEVRRADKIMLPGVGHFAATETLTRSGLAEAVRERSAAGVPFLGICVGLQWLFAGSEEAPEVRGLGVFEGQCARFSEPTLKCPHVGWNALRLERAHPLLAGVDDGAYVYYTHSFRAPVVRETLAATEYGGAFTAVVARDNVCGVQFHPEKSGAAGLRILENFVRL
jgi:imidazole glycerol-phosphate synthase subunit HisH